ncbi:hypothetical protein DFH11DRAFT_1646884 [Phellopilus nigrolimitatus]|nr:hypothetical protein DFH11DRAFT_1646884 [Phellopilus nigrolimitatus]
MSSAPASGASYGNSAGAGNSFFAGARVSSMNANTRRNRNPSPEPTRFSLPLALDDDEDDIDDETDDIDRELDGEGVSSRVETALLNESSGRQSSTSTNENSSAGIRGQTLLLRDRVVSLLGEMDSGSLSASDFEDEPIGRARGDSSPARRHSSFLSSRQGLRSSRSPVGESATDSSRRAGSAQSSASG